MYRIAPLVLLLALFPTAASAAAASNTGYSEDQAQAYFSSVQGCEDVVVGVSVVEPESVKPNTTLAPTVAFVFGSFNNICDVGSCFAFAGIVTLDGDAFDQQGLNGAVLNVTTNIDGFDVAIALTWDGVGKTEKSKNKIHIKN